MQSNTLSGAMAASAVWGRLGVPSPPIPETGWWPQADIAEEAFSSSPGQANRALHQPAAGITRLASTASLGPASQPGVWGHVWTAGTMGHGHESALALNQSALTLPWATLMPLMNGQQGSQTTLGPP